MAPFMLILINNWDLQTKLKIHLRVPTKLTGFVFQYAGLHYEGPQSPPILLPYMLKYLLNSSLMDTLKPGRPRNVKIGETSLS